jgi:hypothetical protein
MVRTYDIDYSHDICCGRFELGSDLSFGKVAKSKQLNDPSLEWDLGAGTSSSCLGGSGIGSGSGSDSGTGWRALSSAHRGSSG